MARPSLRKRRGSAPTVLPALNDAPSSSWLRWTAAGGKGKKRTASARKRSDGSSVEDDGKKPVQIARKLFKVIYAVFKEHDEDGDGVITQEEFVRAVMRVEGRELVGRYSEGMRQLRPTAGETLEKHAVAMLDTLTRSRRIDGEGISLETFVGLYFPYLPVHEVKRACHYYTYKPPKPTKKEKTIDDVEGAREEISAIFERMDSDHDGFVRVSSMRPMLKKIGIQDEDMDEWLQELPGASLQRMKSKLDATDVENLLAPTYIAQVQSPKQLSKAELERQMEWNKEIYLDVIGYK